MRILGIDPGLADAGYGIVDFSNQRLELIAFGAIKTKADISHPVRLKKLFTAFKELIKTYQPDVVAIERLFFARNTKTAMIVAEAKGAITVSLADADIPIFEYTPLQIKAAMVNTKASKAQVQNMVKEILRLEKVPKPNHAADALAAAICHVLRSKFDAALENST